MHYLCPSLKQPANNLLWFLVWSLIKRRSTKLLGWAQSEDGETAYATCIATLRGSYSAGTLILALAALLSLLHCVPYRADAASAPCRGSLLADWDALLMQRGPVCCGRTVVRRMAFSLLRARLSIKASYLEIERIHHIQLLDDAIVTCPAYPHLLDPDSEQYWKTGILYSINHAMVFSAWKQIGEGCTSGSPSSSGASYSPFIPPTNQPRDQPHPSHQQLL